MLRSVFFKSLRDQRRSLFGWTLSIAALVAIMGAIWPSVRNMPELEQFLAAYPEALRELFNIEMITTGAGFMNAELFSAILPALFIVFAISRGSRLLAGDEMAGTLDLLLVTPQSRIRILLEKAGTLLASIVALALALSASVFVVSVAADMDIGLVDALAGGAAMGLLAAEFGALALAAGAMTGRRSVAIGLPAAVAVAGYMLYILGELVAVFEPWAPASPFYQALTSGPLGGGFQLQWGWMAIGTLFFLLAPLPVFDRRDIATA